MSRKKGYSTPKQNRGITITIRGRRPSRSWFKKKTRFVKKPIRETTKLKKRDYGNPVLVVSKRGEKSRVTLLKGKNRDKQALIDCIKRKTYKKQMMKKVAVQVKAGKGSLKKWRDNRAHNRRIWEC
jgi:hypothetical protein